MTGAPEAGEVEPGSVRRIRILVADDHFVVRRGLLSILGDAPDMQVVAEAENGREALAAFRRHRPDVVLLDLRMPGLAGAEVIAALRAVEPAARILVLTIQGGEEAIYRAMKAGAAGYLLKDVPSREILAAIRTVASGQPYVPPALAERLLERVGRPDLTPRQAEVIRLVARGLTDAEIGTHLGISEKSAQTHVAGVLAKLGAQDRTHAARLALDRGLVDLGDLRSRS